MGCEDLPGLGDESWLRREHGEERSPRFSLLEVLSSILRRSERG
jgi:hypothetical protein